MTFCCSPEIPAQPQYSQGPSDKVCVCGGEVVCGWKVLVFDLVSDGHQEGGARDGRPGRPAQRSLGPAPLAGGFLLLQWQALP